jgi:hypothetical protein
VNHAAEPVRACFNPLTCLRRVDKTLCSCFSCSLLIEQRSLLLPDQAGGKAAGRGQESLLLDDTLGTEKTTLIHAASCRRR